MAYVYSFTICIFEIFISSTVVQTKGEGACSYDIHQLTVF